MSTEASVAAAHRKPQLLGQTVVVIGGSAGIGLETARRARAEGADVVLTARDPSRLDRPRSELGARSSAAFDATDPRPRSSASSTSCRRRSTTCWSPPPAPYYAPLAEIDLDQAHREVGHHLWLPILVARHAVGKVRAGGTLLFIGGTGGRRPAVGLTVAAALAAAEPALTGTSHSSSRPSG